MQTLIDRAFHLFRIKPDMGLAIRTVASISLPVLWDSQVIIFLGEGYYGRFFDRNTDCQRWTPLPSDRDLTQEWGLQLPRDFTQRGYREQIRDTDYMHDGEIWFIGNL